MLLGFCIWQKTGLCNHIVIVVVVAVVVVVVALVFVEVDELIVFLSLVGLVVCVDML